jgi:hypothetical protein
MNFANPKFNFIAEKAQLREAKSLLESAIYEIGAWLLIFPGSIILLIIFIFLLGNILGVPGGIITIRIYFLKLRRLAKRNRMNSLKELSKATRDPILYLRSFSLEEAEDPQRGGRKTFEEDLVAVLRDIGPVVAVGLPGEDLSLLGAIRFYLYEYNWQIVIEELMTISQLIIIHAGTSQGLLWEIETALEKIDCSKIFISFSYWQSFKYDVDRAEAYERFKKHAEAVFAGKNVRLPEQIGNAEFLAFNSEGVPVLIETNKDKKLLYNLSASTEMRETLRPFLQERGLTLNWRKTIVQLIPVIWLFISNIISIILIFGVVEFDTKKSPTVLWFFYIIISGIIGFIGYAWLFKAIFRLFSIPINKYRASHKSLTILR